MPYTIGCRAPSFLEKNMYLFIIFVLMLILNVEAVTNIISKSELFKPLRASLFNLSNSRGVGGRVAGFIHDLIDCPYCTSVWVSLFYVLCVYISVNYHLFFYVFLLFCAIISLHRLSNIIHSIIDSIDSNHGL